MEIIIGNDVNCLPCGYVDAVGAVEMKKILTVLEDEQHIKLKQLAKDDGRSMNKTVVRLIEQATNHIGQHEFNNKGEG